MFDPVDPKQSFPKLEHGILEYWRYEDTFKRSLKHRTSPSSGGLRAAGRASIRPAPVHRGWATQHDNIYSFYDGPPFATGLPHYGHLLAGTIKDVIPRYQTMRGCRVERRFGWDCHGLPIENLVEQENGIKSKREIEEKGVKWFNDLCRGSVQRYTKEWRKTVERTGRWVDMDFDYRTMDPEYMESIWWVFKSLYEKGLIYEGYKSMHTCPRCVTPLSNFEVTQGYMDRTDLSVIVAFPLQNDPETVLLAWTTTPWSLPGNLWLAVGPHISYVKVREDDMTYIVAERLIEQVFKGRTYELVAKMQPHELAGMRYQPLFPYFVSTPAQKGKKETYGEKAFRIVLEDAVSEEEGTGIVHLTASHGEDGFRVAQRESVDILHHITLDNHFRQEVVDFKDLLVKPFDSASASTEASADKQGKPAGPMATDQAIAKKLQEMGRLFSAYPYHHSYPHCWRCESPLLLQATSSWFVAVEKIKEELLKCNAQTRWVPEYIRDGRFGKWLEGARDWAISRNRYWGTPLPIWRKVESKEGTVGQVGKVGREGDIVVIGSRDELMSKCPERFTKVTALRHGESEGNVRPIYQGETPGTNLTEKGKQQVEETAKKLQATSYPSDPAIGRAGKLQAIYSSPLARARQTAEIIAEAVGGKVTVDERLREVVFGEHEGKTIDFSDLSFVKARRAHKFETGKPESIYHFAGMETWTDVGKRIDAFLLETLPKHRGEHIVIVTHADPLQNIRHFFTEEDPFKLSHQPYPTFAQPYTFFFDHETGKQLDLHKETVDSIVWGSPLRSAPPSFAGQAGSALREAPRRHAEPVEARRGAPQGDIYKRVPEVLDCWFESGSMPYAQGHFPFENALGQQLTIDSSQLTKRSTVKSQLSTVREPRGFPADFIAEGLDQTRGWFYTLMILSTALFSKPAFRNCVVNGIVLAEDGKKMSKRLKNYPDPDAIMEKCGADAMRFALMASPAVRGEDLRFSEKLVEDVLRRVLLPLWNAYCFFVTYANVAGWEPEKGVRNPLEKVPDTFLHPLDAWILAEAQDLVNRMTAELDRYDLSATCGELHATVDALTDWYIRRSRRRFAGKEQWGSGSGSEGKGNDQESAFRTLYDVLLTLSKLLAPLCPFITEHIYLNLTGDEHGSVHLTDWPSVRALTKEEERLIQETRLVRKIISLGLRIRAERKIKTRQPLPKVKIVVSPAAGGRTLVERLDNRQLMAELNVKSFEAADDPMDLAVPIVRVDPRKLGPRLGAKVQEVIRAAKAGKFAENPDGTVTVLGETLSQEEAQITYQGKEGHAVAAEQGIVVALDTTVTPELAREGEARDLIRAIQALRKDAGLTIDQEATIEIEGADALLKEHGLLILAETKSRLGKSKKARARVTVELPETYVTISLL